MPTTRFLGDLHAFRGFAITNIVFVHALPLYLMLLQRRYGPAYAYGDLHAVSEILFHGSTIYFTFISGALFSAILAKANWGTFFRKKIQFVLLPYIAVSLLYTLIQWQFGEGAIVNTDGVWKRWIANVVLGKAVFTFWYMPVILILFALTPLLAHITRHNRYRWILLILVCMPLVVSRTPGALTFSQVGYFIGAYSVGLWFGRNYEENRRRAGNARGFLFAAVAVASVALLVLFQTGVDWVGPVSIRESVFYVQKLGVTGLAILAFQRFSEVLPRILDALARNAFAIYFFHIFVLRMLVDGASVAIPRPPIGLVMIIGAMLFTSTLAITWLVSRGLQQVLGRYSRVVVGS